MTPLPNSFVQTRRESFHNFVLFVVCIVAHIALSLACLALGTLGGYPTIAMLLFLAGTLAIATGWVRHSAARRRDDPTLIAAPQRMSRAEPVR